MDISKTKDNMLLFKGLFLFFNYVYACVSMSRYMHMTLGA